MTQEEFLEKNPCIAKHLNNKKLNYIDIIRQSEFFKTHKFLFNFLPENWADILKYRYGIYDNNVYSLRETAKFFNLSRERINHIEHCAFNELLKEKYLEILKTFDDISLDDRLILKLINVENYKLLMNKVVYLSVINGQICVLDNIDLNYFILNKKVNISNSTVRKLLQNDIKTIENLLTYLYENKNLELLGICQATFNKIINCIMCMIEEKKLRFTSNEMEYLYMHYSLKYLDDLNKRNCLDVSTFPEHKILEEQELIRKVKEIEQEKKRLEEQKLLICINDRKKAVRHIEKRFKKSITDITLDELGLSMRAYNAFRRANINTIAELIDYYYENKTFNSLKSFGKNTIQEVTDKFKELGLNIEKGALTVL